MVYIFVRVEKSTRDIEAKWLDEISITGSINAIKASKDSDGEPDRYTYKLYEAHLLREI